LYLLPLCLPVPRSGLGLLLLNFFMDVAQQQNIYSFCHHPILCVHGHREMGVHC
jgi:hypothetical protein